MLSAFVISLLDLIPYRITFATIEARLLLGYANASKHSFVVTVCMSVWFVVLLEGEAPIIYSFIIDLLALTVIFLSFLNNFSVSITCVFIIFCMQLIDSSTQAPPRLPMVGCFSG